MEEAPLSPRVTKIAREIAAVTKPDPTSSLTRHPTPPRKICLEQWWLSKPQFGHGFAVSGRPSPIIKCENNVLKKSPPSASATRRYPCASREFHSGVIVKRHGCTTLETSEGVIVSLCGIINSSRSKQNGFSSEVCRDFKIGFPYNWDDYAASVGEISSQGDSCLKELNDSFLPADLDGYNGAQLHDLVFSHTDAGRELLNKKVYDDLIRMLDLQPTNDETQPSKSTLPLSQRSKGSKKRTRYI